jgi:hypothetical protein
MLSIMPMNMAVWYAIVAWAAADVVIVEDALVCCPKSDIPPRPELIL